MLAIMAGDRIPKRHDNCSSDGWISAAMRKWGNGGSLLKTIKKWLLYAGLDKAEFDSLIALAVDENMTSLKWYSLFAAIFFAALFAVETLTGAVSTANMGYYVAMTVFSALLYICARKSGASAKRLVLPLGYAFVMLLYAVSIGLTLLHPEWPAVTIIVVLMITPFLFIDRPINIILLNLLATLTLCVMTLRFKERVIALDDCWNAATFCLVSIGAALKQSQLRFRALAQEARILDLSVTDLLTGTRNRNMFEQRSAEFPQLCRESLTCVFADVNGLHDLNDREGHKAGDRMLQAVAQALLDRFDHDCVFRIGGDEFVVMARDIQEQDVIRNMKEASQELSAQNYSISVGLSHAVKEEIDVQRQLAEAEKEMYQKKRIYYQQPGHERRRR